ncbi:MAG TPA: hypothetical protein VMR25_11825 [Planctomycetaceae bacterium]|jgi:hypothetical protein|nr:hypothetical protein [Planctomycetaceae bacterium]
MTEKPEGSEVEKAKRWFVFCLIIAAPCGIIGTAALCIRPMITPDNVQGFETRMFLFLLGFVLVIIAGPFSIMALFALIDWRSIRRQQ